MFYITIIIGNALFFQSILLNYMIRASFNNWVIILDFNLGGEGMIELTLVFLCIIQCIIGTLLFIKYIISEMRK